MKYKLQYIPSTTLTKGDTSINGKPDLFTFFESPDQILKRAVKCGGGVKLKKL